MNKQVVGGLFVGLILGIGAGAGAALLIKDDTQSKQPLPSMSSSQLVGLSGDNFDKKFIENMIVHHEGAIEMAQQARLNAKHDEIKQMAEAIISAQSDEINKMKDWQKQWGYEAMQDPHEGMEM